MTVLKNITQSAEGSSVLDDIDSAPIPQPPASRQEPETGSSESSASASDLSIVPPAAGAFVPQLRRVRSSSFKHDPSEFLPFDGIPLSFPASSRPLIPDSAVLKPARPAPPATDERVRQPRTEPRFKTDTKSVVEVIRDKAYTFEGRITDLSALGFQIEMAAPLLVGEIIRLTIDGYHMFAQVRHCVPSDSMFKIGVERIEQWDVNEGAVSSPFVTGPQTVLGRPTLKNPLGCLRATALRGLFNDPRLRTKQAKSQATLILAACVALMAWAGGSVIWKSVVHKLPGTATSTSSATNALSVRPITPVHAPTLSTDTANPSNSQTQSSDAQKHAPSPAPQVVSEGTRLQIAASSSAGIPGQVSQSQGSQQQILIKSRGPSWVVACADGKKVFEKLIKDGDTDRFNFSTQALLHAGNGGALDITFNSKSLGFMGQPGNIRAWRFSPEGYTDVPAALNRTCEIP